jgi:diguanylate cyclase (GGDEF)-like protein/PAS domain S-box-containing protein
MGQITHVVAAGGARLVQVLPRGRALPDGVWWQRHRGILILLWLHVPAVFAVAIVQGVGIRHATFEVGIVVALATMATIARDQPSLSTVITSVGLMTCSAELVHLSDGLIEMHFHYFVMVGVVTLYQDWRPFLVAIGYVVVQHGVAGVFVPESVYNHPAAVADPWQWAAVHGFFIMGMSVAGIITWRLNESLLEAATDREHKLAEAQELARIGSWEYRADLGRAIWSKEMYRLLGVDETFETTGDAVLPLIHPDDREAWKADMDRATADGVPHLLDFRVVLPDGTERWLHGRGAVTRWENGVAAVMSGTVQDVTERRQSEDALRSHEAELRHTLSLLSATLDSTADGILVVDVEGRISSFNGKFVEMWRIPGELLASRDDSAALNFVLEQLADPDGFVAKVTELYAQPESESYDTIAFKDGRVVERFSTPQRVGGRIVGRVWSFRDVTERNRLEDELAHQAFHDSLTGLANQALFRDRVEHAVARLGRREDAQLAVLFLDLDNFKMVNDSLGHTVGDRLLVAVTERLQGCLRPGDTAARMGGDEFAVLLEDIQGTQDATDVAERVLQGLRQPVQVAGKDVYVSTSIGIAVDDPGARADQLLRNADLAMYTAKRLGKNRYELFAPEMHAAAVERLEVEADLRRACERGELHLDYQPIVSLATGELASVEALVRWAHPVRGVLPPTMFVEFAEESGLIEDIGRWVLGEACTQVRRWQLDHPRSRPLTVSVNVSPRQLRNPALVDDVVAVLERTGLDAGCLTLEITEGAMMHDTEVALAHLQALKALGVRLALDDFGTGYSSLSYLQRFPIDVLKVDRSFVQRVEHGPEESALARAIVRLAQTLRMTAVAEGVENARQADVLRDMGCGFAQGFHLCRPVPADAIDALLAEGTIFGGAPATAGSRPPSHRNGIDTPSSRHEHAVGTSVV